MPRGRGALAGAAATWLGALAGMVGPARAPVLVGGVALALALGMGVRGHGRSALFAALVVAGTISGAAAAQRIDATLSADLDPGSIDVVGEVTADPVPAGYDWRVLVRAAIDDQSSRPVVLALETEDRPDVVVGDLVRIAGDLRARPGRLRGDPYAGTVRADDLMVVTSASGLVFGLGNAMRAMVLNRLEPHFTRPAAGLLAGFLVGDTTHLTSGHLDNLRSSGLTHYIAVSGSNVALFLGAWWIVSGPLPLGTRLRAAGGLVALVVFVVATRWEPSVVRASAMAAVVLGGRMLGFPVDAWRALGVAVMALLLASGDLAVDVGFQLSVGATAGVLVGTAIPLERRPRWLWRSLAVTASAQLAVLPILLATFGSVPLLSPLANLIAAPVVTVATIGGASGLALGIRPLLDLGLTAADGVLLVADRAAGWPQLGVGGSLAVVAGLGGLQLPRLRPAIAAMAVAWVLVAAVPPAPPPWPAITFLDVGQGDAILLRSPEGRRALVDGGGDPAVLAAALRRVDVADLDLLIVTHGDSDHVGGLVGLFDAVDVGEVWYPDLQERSAMLESILAAAIDRGIPVAGVRAGRSARLGELELQILSPARRFAAENDGSVVMWVAARGVTALLTGDAEAVAQAELPRLRPDVLQVPHHGSATTDVRWLVGTVGGVAVISVGPNAFGHPTDEVMAALASTGAIVHLTQRDGDVTVPLCAPCDG